MNFERHKDPMDSIDIGIKKSMPELKKMYNELKHVLESNRHRALPEHEEAKDALLKSRPKRLMQYCGWTNLNFIFPALTSKEFAVVYTTVKKYNESIDWQEVFKTIIV